MSEVMMQSRKHAESSLHQLEDKTLEEMVREWAKGHEGDFSMWMKELNDYRIRDMEKLVKMAQSSRWQWILERYSPMLVAELEYWYDTTLPELTESIQTRKKPRLSVQSPVNKNVDHSNTIVPGRGTKLGKIPVVKKAIEDIPVNAEILDQAHTFVFTCRTKPAKTDLKSTLLEFSGFLEPKVQGESKEERKEKDDEARTKMSQKAFKLTANEVRDLCDFFHIDLIGCYSKEGYIDCLLDFLGQPREDLCMDLSNKAEDREDEEMKDTDEKEEKGADKKEEDEDEHHEGEEEHDEEAEEGATKKKGKKKSATSEKTPTFEPNNRRRSLREKPKIVTALSFVPEDFKNVDRSITIVPGRGTKLGDIPVVKKAIDGIPINSEILNHAHKFVFTRRGKPAKKDLKPNLLEFSGFLEAKVEGESKEEREKKDEEAEAKMSLKAFKLRANEVRSLCVFFHIDRTGHTRKEGLIDCLLDFLGQPREDLCKGFNKNSSSNNNNNNKNSAEKGDAWERESTVSSGIIAAHKSKKKPSKLKIKEEYEKSDEEEEPEVKEPKEDEGGDEASEAKETSKGSSSKADAPAAVEVSTDDSDEELLHPTKGKMPSDKMLHKWVKLFVRCYDTETVNFKIAMTIAQEKFGVKDMSTKKDQLKKWFAEEV